MPNSSCVIFQDSWVKDPSFSPWLKRSGSKNNEAYCTLCKKTIDYKSMGRSALVSHMKGKKHLSLASASSSSDKCNMLNFFTNSKGKLTTPTVTEQSSPAPTFATPSMDLFVSEVCLKQKYGGVLGLPSKTIQLHLIVTLTFTSKGCSLVYPLFRNFPVVTQNLPILCLLELCLT